MSTTLSNPLRVAVRSLEERIREPAQYCGCKEGRMCKHYYANQRHVISRDAERHTTEETGGAALGSPSHQTYLDLTGWGQVLVTPTTSPRLWRKLSKRAKRL